ncbi:uncharacterized protein THITE_2112102 [Thermothielavioides terrestris NRRL 8126]|uniref:Uncharacterized protein n=1 Tax=Thermothielavioides terrestris (strain ATCC 38088 / NRRL 8126) TaxID=578455 RepID=G2R4N0_THETT|nr:uncharacterized protein THITE_2112102 [Thermothielavioides terrestris NRRL 8126]AEO65265.1 hypothetical protein THITE_2112102 [Thermothielavioides terrestris NRRL 8126]
MPYTSPPTPQVMPSAQCPESSAQCANECNAMRPPEPPFQNTADANASPEPPSMGQPQPSRPFDLSPTSAWSGRQAP